MDIIETSVDTWIKACVQSFNTDNHDLDLSIPKYALIVKIILNLELTNWL